MRLHSYFHVHPHIEDSQPRWPAIIALAAVGALHMALPSALTIGPPWLLFVVVAVLLVPTVIAHNKGFEQINYVLGLTIPGVVTVFVIWSLVRLIEALPKSNPEMATLLPVVLLQSAAALWITNILIFALWYWRLDAGGPHCRDLKSSHTDGAFLFPQMMMSDTARAEAGETDWTPGFVDYLFLAFNTSTAFSPTDTSVLSRWAKMLMMIQATISLIIIALLAARAVNIL